MTSLSDEQLVALLLTEDKEAFDKLLEYRHDVGQVGCVRRMLSLFESCRSAELCKKAWKVTLTVCLADDQAEMDDESSRLWTQAFLRALTSPNSEIREASANAWGLGLRRGSFSESILQSLSETLLDEAQGVRFAAGHLLRQAGPAALPYLLRALADTRYHTPHQNREDRCSSVWDVLFAIDGILRECEVGPEDTHNCAQAVADFLARRSVHDGLDRLDIWKGGDTLGEHIGGTEGLRKLTSLITHTDPRVRASVAHGLSHIGGPEAVEGLKALADDSVEYVRIEALKYLKRVR
jgi:hypothetical protein